MMKTLSDLIGKRCRIEFTLDHEELVEIWRGKYPLYMVIDAVDAGMILSNGKWISLSVVKYIEECTNQ